MVCGLLPMHALLFFYLFSFHKTSNNDEEEEENDIYGRSAVCLSGNKRNNIKDNSGLVNSL